MVRRTTSLYVLLGGTLASLAGAASPLPLVIWHGLGDTFDNPGLQSVADLYTSIYPGASTHIIHLADDGGGDRKASYFGSLHGQMELVCDQLSSNPNLTSPLAPHGFHALGFSQGGLFMRGYVEACNLPRVHTLVTFGSPHNGISEFVKCKTTDWLCRTAFGWLNANKWSDWVQSNIVPAQYYRHPSSEEMVIIPKESVWFAEVVEDGEVTWLTERELYQEDWIGLKRLDEAGKLKFLKTGGPHMHITDELLAEVYTKYLWQPEGVVAREVDGRAFNERLMTLAEPPIGDESGRYGGDMQEPLLQVQN
ncbi:uncharacterized protein DFL_000745 [Arthrobotrys flagrans]|uniref:Palmitoyl-protein thioesterase 1 n=1 Tax=Arthrobotrys flagrans TaxID=97331 RepID=A0A437AES0_ARTFL|nr:hypothetical protein DFL_000745 [Arthrobotrys flagrans]